MTGRGQPGGDTPRVAERCNWGARGPTPEAGPPGGDPADFAARVAPHRGSLERMLRRLLPTPEDAEDVLQEALLHAFIGLACLARPELFGPWLRTVAYNRAMEWQRRRYAERALRLVPPAADGGGLEHAEERLDVIAALRLLRPAERRLVVLRYAAQVPAAEIARAEGVSAATVRSRLLRARRLLRERIADGEGGSGDGRRGRPGGTGGRGGRGHLQVHG